MIFTVFGPNLSGKTFFVKHAIIPNYKCLVWDPNKGDQSYPENECDIYHPKHRGYPESAEEFEVFLAKYVKPNRGKYDLLIVDEASSVFPCGYPLLPQALDLRDTYRHDQWGNLGIGFLCRRPATLRTDFIELSHYLFSFGNRGAHDISRFNQEAQGLGDVIQQLGKYEYVVADPDRHYIKMPPWKKA